MFRGRGCDLDVGLPGRDLLWERGRRAARSRPPRSDVLGLGQRARGPSADTPVTQTAPAQPSACVCIASLFFIFFNDSF